MCQRKKWFLHGLLFVMVMFILTGWSGEVQSQPKYPTRAIDIIVPFSAGGGADLVNRIMTSYMRKSLGVPVNVINKPGGNTVPACLELYHAAPDGYTLLGDNNPTSSMLPIVVKNLPFKIMDRTFIAVTSISPMIIFVPFTSPIKSLKDLEMEAKKNPENFTWTSMGGAGSHDFVIRQFLKAIAVDILKTKPVMCQGGAQAAALTAGGHVVMGMNSIPSSLSVIKGGMVRPLAITSKNRWPDLPDLPTTEESGYPGIDYLYWNGTSGPPKLPSHVVEVWDKVLQEMLKDPEVISQLKNVGAIPFYRNAREAREYVLKEAEEVEKLWSLK
jgi:tripartite-type tricarboxylate transporter receptor subunit TctC